MKRKCVRNYECSQGSGKTKLLETTNIYPFLFKHMGSSQITANFNLNTRVNCYQHKYGIFGKCQKPSYALPKMVFQSCIFSASEVLCTQLCTKCFYNFHSQSTLWLVLDLQGCQQGCKAWQRTSGSWNLWKYWKLSRIIDCSRVNVYTHLKGKRSARDYSLLQFLCNKGFFSMYPISGLLSFSLYALFIYIEIW